MPNERFERATSLPARRRGYRREIVAVLCLKAAGLGLLYVLFFAPNDRPPATGDAVARHLLASPPAAAGNEVTHDR